MEKVSSTYYKPSSTHLELGLNAITQIIARHEKSNMPDAYHLLKEQISKEGNEKVMNQLSKALGNIKKEAVLVCVGYELAYIEEIIPKFKVTIVVPNDSDVNVDRIRDNYLHVPNFRVLGPLAAADLILPNCVVVVPVYPLDDGTILTYSYPSRIVNGDLKRNGFQIIGIEQSSPLSISYGFDSTGLTTILHRIDPMVFTHYITY